MVVLVIEVPLVLGAMDDGTPLPYPVEPDVSVDDSATEEAVDARSLYRPSREAAGDDSFGCKVVIKLIASRGLSKRDAVAWNFWPCRTCGWPSSSHVAACNGLKMAKILPRRAWLCDDTKECFLEWSYLGGPSNYGHTKTYHGEETSNTCLCIRAASSFRMVVLAVLPM